MKASSCFSGVDAMGTCYTQAPFSVSLRLCVQPRHSLSSSVASGLPLAPLHRRPRRLQPLRVLRDQSPLPLLRLQDLDLPPVPRGRLPPPPQHLVRPPELRERDSHIAR